MQCMYVACMTSTATQEKPDWRHAEAFENRVLVPVS